MKITDKLIKASCSSIIYKRGVECFRSGRVHLRKREEGFITAVVDDKNVFSVEVEYNETRITKSFCTCPYHQTMRTPCKHIIAAMCQLQAELEEGGSFTDENDKLAKQLCSEYEYGETKKEKLHVSFIMYVSSETEGKPQYGMSMIIGDGDDILDVIENFLEHYLIEKRFKLTKKLTYIPGVTEFSDNDKAVIDALAGAYSDRSAGSRMYSKAVYKTHFGESTAAKIFPYINRSGIAVVIDGINYSGMKVIEENPDILIDVFCTDEDITLATEDRGLAMTESGEWFFFDGNLYKTDSQWREYYMPIYRALASENRTQIVFKGANRMLFAKYVLPKLDNRNNVIMQGIENIIVDERPEFKVYFDTYDNGISAVVTADYGNITVRLPNEVTESDRIVIRDVDAENNLLGEFSGFYYDSGIFTLYDSGSIFEFVKNSVPRIESIATIYYSKRFENMFSENELSVSVRVEYRDDIDLLDVGFESSLSPEELAEILRAVRLKKNYYRLKSGAFLDFSNEKKMSELSAFEQFGFSASDIMEGHKNISRINALAINASNDIKKAESFKKLIRGMKNVRAKIPKSLKDVLRDYQKDGIKWLTELSKYDFGGILADDMGLGKTLQVLAYIHGIKPETPTLIVTPSALTYNWQNEIKRFIPDATSLVIDGKSHEREELLRHIGDYEFVITSYPLLRRDVGSYTELGISFEYMFIDEAQHIKNAKTMNARSVKRIKARHKFAITGTPIENSLSELWSVFDFIMRGYLGSYTEFKNRYEQPIMKDHNRLKTEQLKNKISPFIMRRMKTEVLFELPEKIEETIYAELTEHQKNMYSAYLGVAKSQTVSLLRSGGDKMLILTLLLRLRQICCHPVLFDENYTHDSGKLRLLEDLILSGTANGHRILVFSQFTSMLDIIGEELEKLGVSYFYLSGKTPSSERSDMSERFNNGEREVFLISLRAGGVGLNLTGADMVIHYDPWWNPAVMDQASDRAYRIGQTRAVQIIRLAARGTIEEKILKLQGIKRELADDIIASGGQSLKNLSDDEILELFS